MAQPAALTDQTLLSTDPQAMALSRQQQMADLLTQNSMQQPTGQVISGRYVAPSWSQQLQPLFNAAAGAYLSHNAENKQQALAEALRGKQQEAIQNYANATTPQERFAAGTSQYAPAELQKSAYSMVSPQKLGADETLQQLDFGTGKYAPLASGVAKLPPELSIAQKSLNLPSDPTQWTPQQSDAATQYMMQLKRSGATNVNVSTGKSLAEQIGPMMTNSMNQATGAMKTIDAANQIDSALKSGNIISGPGANVRLPLAQIATTIGAGGANDAEKLANTQQLIQNLAKLTLNGRQQMHGEGAISNSESNIAEKAMSGNVSLTPIELQQLSNAAKRAANYQVQSHQQKLQIMGQNPETKAFAPYFQVNPMTSGNVPPSSNNVVDYNSLK